MNTTVILGILGVLVGVPSAAWALVKLGGWASTKRRTSSNNEVGWQDFVDDIQSLEGASNVNSHQEDYRISLEYNRSRRQFHQQTKYDYEILDFKKPLLMVEPLG